jgi:hypothetical protein
MKRICWQVALLVGLSFGLGAEQAQAQFQYVQPQTNPYNTPAVSPFVNLNRGGNPGANYFGIIQPQIQAQQGLSMLTQQQQLLEQQMYAMPGQDPLGSGISGHPVYFRNYLHYFPQSGGIVTGTGFGAPGGGFGAPGGGFGAGGASFGAAALIRR